MELLPSHVTGFKSVFDDRNLLFPFLGKLTTVTLKSLPNHLRFLFFQLQNVMRCSVLIHIHYCVNIVEIVRNIFNSFT